MIDLKKFQSGRYLPIVSTIPKINERLGGLHTKLYTLVGASSGVGKTTFVDYIFLHNYGNTHILYYSLELGKDIKLAQWLSLMIWENEGVDIPPMAILGRRRILTQEELTLVNKYTPELEERMKSVVILDKLDSPQELRKATANTPENTVIFIDHIALVGEGNKLTIDSISKEIVWLRNNRNIGAVVVQQFNNSMGSTYRDPNMKQEVLIPDRLDFGDSTYTFRDADLVFGGVCPAKHHFEKYGKYDLRTLKNRAVFWYLIKDRYFGNQFQLPFYRNTDAPMIELLPEDPDDSFYNKFK